jgi:hypothetical protein
MGGSSSLGRVPGPPGAAGASPEVHGAFVSWGPPADPGSSPVTGYEITSVPAGAQVTVGLVFITSITGLADGASYTVEVRAMNAVGLGPPTTSNMFTTPPRANAPNPVVVTTTYGAARVSWNGPNESLQNYVLDVTDSMGAVQSFTLPPGQGGDGTYDHSFFVPNLADAGTYTFSLTAVNNVGPSTPVVRTATLPCANIGLPGRPQQRKGDFVWNGARSHVADFNNDGHKDVITVGYNTSTYLGRGNGTFDRSIESVRLDQAQSTTGDFNGDGFLDYVADVGGVVALFVNDQTGAFNRAPQNVGSILGGLTDLAAGDVNGNGTVDLVVANGTLFTLSVFLNSGPGLFPQRLDIPTLGHNVHGVELVDINGDTFLDLVLGVAFASNSGMEVRLGNGDGTFGSPTYFPAAGWNEVKLADLNSDGALDVVAVGGSIGGGGGSQEVSVFLGNGAGSFAPAAVTLTNCFNDSIAIADVNGDTTLDLVLGNSGGCVGGTTPTYTPGFVVVLPGNGDGTFDPEQLHPMSRVAPRSIFVADLDEDTVPDIVIGNAQMMSFTAYRGLGNGTFLEQYWRTAQNITSDLMVLDVTGSNTPDVLELGFFQFNGVPGGRSFNIHTFPGVGDGTLAPATLSPVPSRSGGEPRYMTSADFNGDGRPDIAVVDVGILDVTIMLGQAGGAFTQGASYAYSGGAALAVTACDLNADNRVDLVVNRGNGITIWAGNGNGTFGIPYILEEGTNTGRSIACGDVDEDNDPDLVFTTQGGLLLNQGGFAFTPAPLNAGGDIPSPALIRDVNGDGHVDILYSHSGNITVVLGAGNGTFSPPRDSPLPVYVGIGGGDAFALADFDLDGIQDVVAAGSFGSFGILFGDTTGSYIHALTFSAGTEVRNVAAADMNGDSRPDVVAITAYGDAHYMEVFTNNQLNLCF